jgi:hypothetical protein
MNQEQNTPPTTPLVTTLGNSLGSRGKKKTKQSVKEKQSAAKPRGQVHIASNSQKPPTPTKILTEEDLQIHVLP